MTEIPAAWDLSKVIKKLLTPERCEQMDVAGYLILDDAPLPEDMAKAFLQEVKRCFTDVKGGKVPNEVEFLTRDGAVKLTKPHIYECDLHQKQIRQQLSLFDNVFESQLGDLVEVLRDRLACCEDLVDMHDAESTAKAVTVKLQMNEGGAFPWHYDNPARPNKRRLTMAVYLTEGWTAAKGGEIQLQPFLGKPVTVAPRFNTIVMFRSDTILHRVRPIVRSSDDGDGGFTRYCFTIWFDGFLTNTDEDQLLKVSHLQESMIPFLKRSPVQRTLSRAVYAQEYRAALLDCFGDGTPACRVSLQEHEAHVRQLVADERVRQFVELLHLYREDKQSESSLNKKDADSEA